MVYYIIFVFHFKVAKKDHSKNDCLLVFVMTYAIDDSPYIYAQDKKYEVDQIWNNFRANICHISLVNKPKIFVIHVIFNLSYSIVNDKL